jgi:hypothetical protein
LLKQAEIFYQEYLEYKNDRKPGEEYELIQNWGQDLKLDTYFKLVLDPNNGHQSVDPDRDPLLDTLESIESDPFDLESNDEDEQAINANFKATQESQGLNMAVVTYMIDALNFFKNKPHDDISEIAIDIAMHGRQGFSTQ